MNKVRLSAFAVLIQSNGQSRIHSVVLALAVLQSPLRRKVKVWAQLC